MYSELKQISICDLMRNQTFSLHAQVKCYQQYLWELYQYLTKKIAKAKAVHYFIIPIDKYYTIFFFKSRNTSIKTWILS